VVNYEGALYVWKGIVIMEPVKPSLSSIVGHGDSDAGSWGVGKQSKTAVVKTFGAMISGDSLITEHTETVPVFKAAHGASAMEIGR
jgi:hypothetical protein